MIELPEFMTATVVERTYRRAMELQDRGREPWWNGGGHARKMRKIGLRMAMARDGRFMLFLERGAEYLRARNDEQVSRFEQLGYPRQSEFSEYSLFRNAYEKADAPDRDEQVLHDLFGWVYAAVAEALQQG